MILREQYPATTDDAPTAVVNLDGIIDSLKPSLLETGAWLNIMGYIRSRPEDIKISRKARVSFVDAALLWSAGIVRLEKYQAAVTELQECIAKG